FHRRRVYTTSVARTLLCAAVGVAGPTTSHRPAKPRKRRTAVAPRKHVPVQVPGGDFPSNTSASKTVLVESNSRHSDSHIKSRGNSQGHAGSQFPARSTRSTQPPVRRSDRGRPAQLGPRRPVARSGFGARPHGQGHVRPLRGVPRSGGAGPPAGRSVG